MFVDVLSEYRGDNADVGSRDHKGGSEQKLGDYLQEKIGNAEQRSESLKKASDYAQNASEAFAFGAEVVAPVNPLGALVIGLQAIVMGQLSAIASAEANSQAAEAQTFREIRQAMDHADRNPREGRERAEAFDRMERNGWGGDNRMVA